MINLLALLKNHPYLEYANRKVAEWEAKHGLHEGDLLLSTERFYALIKARHWVEWKAEIQPDGSVYDDWQPGAVLTLERVADWERDLLEVGAGNAHTGGVPLELVQEMRQTYLDAQDQ